MPLSLMESDAFIDALDGLPPDAATACAGWRVHELVAHIAAGGEEIAGHVEAHLDGRPIPRTRGFADREAPFRAMPYDELLRRLTSSQDRLRQCLGAALDHDPAAEIEWSGRTVPLAFFVTHARSELTMHRWDLVGDDATSLKLLGQEELTVHAVNALGDFLVAGGRAPTAGHSPVHVRLRAAGQQDVVLEVGTDGASLAIGEATDTDEVPFLSSDAAARLLLLWGRQPATPTRMRTNLSPDRLDTVRGVLAGL